MNMNTCEGNSVSFRAVVPAALRMRFGQDMQNFLRKFCMLNEDVRHREVSLPLCEDGFVL